MSGTRNLNRRQRRERRMFQHPIHRTAMAGGVPLLRAKPLGLFL